MNTKLSLQYFNVLMDAIRDIPMPLVTSGVEHGNLRELALARMNDLGTKVRTFILLPHIYKFNSHQQCRDVRTREVGIQEIHHKVRPYEVCVNFTLIRHLPSKITML